MKKIIIALAFLGIAFAGQAQQDPAYSMYLFNGLYVNPAYAGSHEVMSLVGIFRQQWVDMDGAPTTANISINTPFRRPQYAMGLVVSNDKIGLGNTFSFTPSFAYRIKIRKSHLCFGLQASFAYFYRNNSKSDLPSGTPDNTTSVNTNLFMPNVGFGIYLYGKKYFIGVSAPHLMPSSLRSNVGLLSYNDAIARIYNYYVLTAGYVVGREQSVVKFRPSLMMKWQQGLPNNIPQFDFNLALLFIDRIWVGAGLRTQGDAYMSSGSTLKFGPESLIAFAQVRITPQLQLGYAYDYSLSNLHNANSGTHEIMLGYDFWYDKKRFVTPRYVSYF